MTQTPPARLLTTTEAADHLRVSPRTLERWRIDGDGPRYCRVGRRAVYRRADLDEFVEDRLATRTSSERSPDLA